MRKDSEVFLRKLLEYKNEVQKENFSINFRYFKKIPSIESAIYDILKDLINNNCLTSNSQVTDLEGNININLTLDGITYFDDFENKDRGKSIFLNVSGGQVNIATDNGNVEAMQKISNQGTASGRNKNIDVLKNMSQILKDVYEELENVLCAIDKYVAHNSFYLDYKIICEKGVMFVIETYLANVKQDDMIRLFNDLWIKSFCEKGMNVDFRDIYILVYLLKRFNIQIDFKIINQKMEIPERIEYDSSGYFWKSKMESFFYLLEICPYIYENLNNGLKIKLKIAAEKNLGYIVREFYLYDNIDKHLEKIESERKAIYARQRGMNLYGRIWVPDNFIFLREMQQNDIDKWKIDKYVIGLFCNSINFDMTESLWKYVKKYLSNLDTIEILDIMAAMDTNSQIYERKKEPNIIIEFIENCNYGFDLSGYPNIKTICRRYGLLTEK